MGGECGDGGYSDGGWVESTGWGLLMQVSYIHVYPTHQFSICNGCAACVSIVGVQCATCR